ncbi:MAG: dTDP-4-dehydrorhamnose reductase [Oligoflexia bacterium]|nr:dTDP-4-dehydrorhamnose reductase [Oligoflexia bacterium]
MLLTPSAFSQLPGPVLIFGATGQLGSALTRILGEKAIGLTRDNADLSAPESLATVLDQHSPRLVINAAAHTLVDQAEKEEGLAYRLNAEAPGAIARWCARANVPFVHYSTDYVFSGQGVTRWKEDDATGPLNAYGRSKLAGERLVAEAGGRWLIFRVSWVYAETGKNFFTTMLRLGKDRETLSVVTDQYGAPSYAPDLAELSLLALTRALEQEPFPGGVYHLCPTGETTWHGFTSRILDRAREKGLPIKTTRVLPITASEYPTPARRPANSRLDTSKIQKLLKTPLPSWESGLERCLEALQ